MKSEPDLRRITVGRCILLGDGFALLSFVTIGVWSLGNVRITVMTGPEKFPWMAALPVCGVGTVIGAACSALVIPLLWRKPGRAVLTWLILIVGPVVMLTALVACELRDRTDNELTILSGGPVCASILTALVLRFALPDLPRPGHCSRCGYNLTGNESGTCPECGTEVERG